MIRFASIFLLALTLAAAALPARAAKDELTIGINQFPSTFHPAIDSMLAKTYILSLVRRPITTYDKDWKLICMLCVELPTLENGLARKTDLGNGKSGVAVTFTLPPDTKWADGRPVTSDDVVFTWQVGKHPQSGISNYELYKRILKIEAKDPRTFTFHFDRLTYDYNVLNDFHILPAHIEKTPFRNPFDYKNRTLYDTNTANPGLYNGPYRVTDVKVGAHVVLETNPHWNGTKPHFKRIVVKVMENTAALEANLLSGGIDMIAGELGLTLDQALAFEKRHGSKYDIVYKSGLIYEHIDFNLGNPILADKKVRHALLRGLDRDAMNAQLFEGRQPPAASMVNPLDWVYARDLGNPGYDPAKAAALLDDAGWKQGGDGIRRNVKGDKLALELMTTAGNRSRELVQQVLQSQWKKLGVEVRLKNEPARIFFAESVTKRRFTGMAMFAWISAPESPPRSTLHSAHIPKVENNWAGQNYTGYVNPKFDDLIDKLELELDREKRRAIWRDIQTVYMEDLPALPLFFRADAFILPKNLKGVEPTGHQNVTTLWAENWRWE